MTLVVSVGPPRERGRWRLNPWLFKCAEFQGLLHRNIKKYFEVNLGSVESEAILWEAPKATIRGTIISYSTNRKRIQRQECAELEARALDLETRYLVTSDPPPC